MTTLYVGKFNLATVGEEQLRRAFQPFGSLSWVRVKEGYAFVDFAEERAAQDAYQAHGQGLVLCGERMVVRWAKLQQQKGGAQAKFRPVETRGSDECRFGRHHVRNGRPSCQGMRRFCTICRRAGHDTHLCYYNTAAKRENRGGVERGAKDAAWRGRGADIRRDKRRDEDTGRLTKGTNELRGGGQAEHRQNARDRGTLEGEGLACRGNPVKKPAVEGTSGRGKAHPPEGKGADFENAKALVCAAETRASGSKRKGQTVSRGRSRSRSVTRCSDSRCSCHRDRRVSVSPPRSLTPSSCTASSASRGRHPPCQALPPQKGKQEAPPRTTPWSVTPLRKKQNIPVDLGMVERAMGPPVGKGNRGAGGEGRTEKWSGSGVSPGMGAEVEKAGVGAQDGKGEERKRKWETDERATGTGRDMGQAETANGPPPKRAQLSTLPKPTPIDHPPQDGSLPTKSQKRLELAMLGKEDVVIPRITEWQFETEEDAAEDGEITSINHKRPLPGTDLPARLRPIRWRNIGKDAKRGRGWKKGLEILARGWESGRPKEARGVDEEPQGRTGLERKSRTEGEAERGVIVDPSKVLVFKESLGPSSGTVRKATKGGSGDTRGREERMEPRLPTADTSSRGARMWGSTSGNGPPKQGDAAVHAATERMEAGGQATGLLRVKGGLERNMGVVEPAGGRIDPGRLTELHPAVLQSVQGFEAVPVRYKKNPEVRAPAPACADGPDPAKASEISLKPSGRPLGASERPREASRTPPDAPASPAGAPEITEMSGNDARVPRIELRAPESMAPRDTSSPEQHSPPESKPSPEAATESVPTPKSAGSSDPKSLSEPRTPLPGSESAAPQPADESAPTSGGGNEFQPLIVEPSTADPKRKRGRPPANKPPKEPRKAPKPEARVTPAMPLSTEGPKRKRGRPRKIRDPPGPAPGQKLPVRRKTVSVQQPGDGGPERADASPTPAVVASGEDGSLVDIDDLPLSDRVAEAIKARESILTRAKTRGAGAVLKPATAESNQGTLSDWPVEGKESLEEAGYAVQTEQNVCLLVFPKDRSEAHQTDGQPDPYSQLVLDFPRELTPEMVLEPSAFSGETRHKASDFVSLLPRLLLPEGAPAMADQAVQSASGALPQPTWKETRPAKDDRFKGVPLAGSGGLVPEDATAERAILPCRPDRNLKTAPG